MQRTRQSLKIPDAINCSVSKNFTQIPNELIKNPNLSGKAKTILCILLSNKKGWCSYIQTIKQMMKEGEEAIRTGISELEEHKYLLRIRYRCKTTKTWKGSFWAYTDIPGQFNIQEHIRELHEKEMEPFIPENPDVGNPDVGNPGLIILYSNKIKDNNSNLLFCVEEEISLQTQKSENITPSQFAQFWQAYPKKVDKGKALSVWKKLCARPIKDRPTLLQVKRAIHRQQKSDRWQNPQFIPHPTTWLNQSRWLDDPKEMKEYRTNSQDTTPQAYDPGAWRFDHTHPFKKTDV